MNTNIRIGGSGGQGVMLIGQMLAKTAVSAGLETVCMPSYGPEKRGGTAYCSVVVADEAIDTPLFDHPDYLLSLNPASLAATLPEANEKTVILYNAPSGERGDALCIPCGDLALSIGAEKAVNMVMLGALLRVSGILTREAVFRSLEKQMAGREALIAKNKAAIDLGWQAAEDALKQKEC